MTSHHSNRNSFPLSLFFSLSLFLFLILAVGYFHKVPTQQSQSNCGLPYPNPCSHLCAVFRRYDETFAGKFSVSNRACGCRGV